LPAAPRILLFVLIFVDCCPSDRSATGQVLVCFDKDQDKDRGKDAASVGSWTLSVGCWTLRTAGSRPKNMPPGSVPSAVVNHEILRLRGCRPAAASLRMTAPRPGRRSSRAESRPRLGPGRSRGISRRSAAGGCPSGFPERWGPGRKKFDNVDEFLAEPGDQHVTLRCFRSGLDCRRLAGDEKLRVAR
jgi:hypothetical protein